MNGPAYTSLATLRVESVNFDVNPGGIVTRTILTDSFGVDFAFTGSPQEWLDFAMRVSAEIHQHASTITAEQLDGSDIALEQTALQTRQDLRRAFKTGGVIGS